MSSLPLREGARGRGIALDRPKGLSLQDDASFNNLAVRKQRSTLENLCSGMSLRAQRSNLVVGSNYIASYFSPHPEIATVACGDLAMTWRSRNILIAIADLGSLSSL